MPDKVWTTTGDVEHRMGIQPLEELLAERDTLVKRVADLRAKHGSWGTHPDLRKIELAQIAQAIRLGALRDGVKLTESAIDEAAHADPRYIQFVVGATKERAEWAILEGTIEGIDFTIQRGQAVARFLSQEVGLSR